MRSEQNFEEMLEDILECIDSALLRICTYQHKQTELLEKLVELNQPENQKAPAKRKKPPSVDEVKAYVKEIDAGIDPNSFVDYYEARGWKLKGGDPVKDWKACVRTWMRNGFSQKPKEASTGVVL